MRENRERVSKLELEKTEQQQQLLYGATNNNNNATTITETVNQHGG